jgi:copper chaperone CopZ
MIGDNMEMRPDARKHLCPLCGSKGRKVKPITIESLLTDEARGGLSRTDGFRFCQTPTCDVSYFHSETGEFFQVEDVRVRIGFKQSEPPRPICYCFDYTMEQIEEEIAQGGTSKIAATIRGKCEEGLSRCEENNPQGSCCLGNVSKLVQECSSTMAGQPDSETAGEELPDCCAGEAPEASSKKTLAGSSGSPKSWVTGGAVVTAVLSSVCCWLPLLLITFGVSAAGTSGFLEAYRLYLLGATGLLLAAGFYLVYFRKEQCAPGSACEIPNPRLKRFNKIMIWVATVVVLLFAFFPNYAGYLLAGSEDAGAASGTLLAESRAYGIEGITCEACAIHIEAQLKKVPGVVRAEVSYKNGTATVFYDSIAAAPTDRQIRRAIEEAGYRTTPEDTE